MGDYDFIYSENQFKHEFADTVVFPYFNNADRLRKYIDNKNKWKKIIPIIAKNVKFSNLLNEMIGFNLVSDRKDKKGLVEEIAEVFIKSDGTEITLDWFNRETNRLKEKELYFENVSKTYNTRNTIFDRNSKIASPNLDGKFIILEGNICLKDSLSTNLQFYDSLSKAKNDWLACNFPPEGMTPQNTSYSPDCVLLNFDKNFEEVFSSFVPFNKSIGWFPKCKIAGFFDQKTIGYQNYPTIDVSIIQYTKPKHPDKIINDFIDYLLKEQQRPNLLREFHTRVYMYYFISEMISSWNIRFESINEEFKKILGEYVDKDISFLSERLGKYLREITKPNKL